MSRSWEVPPRRKACPLLDLVPLNRQSCGSAGHTREQERSNSANVIFRTACPFGSTQIHGCAGSKCLLVRFDDMRVASLTSLVLLATVTAPLAAPYRIDSRHHQEGRPDAATLVPPDWRLQRDEQRYVSPDGSSWFAPHASSVGSEPIARHMDRIAGQEGETVTYFRREPDWIAVSGFKAGRIFYRKAVLACGGKIWHHIEFEYPAALKRRMDPFVNRASYSIDHAETTDCREPQ